MESSSWKSTVGSITVALSLYVIAGFVVNVCDAISSTGIDLLSNLMDMAMAFEEGNFFQEPDFTDIIEGFAKVMLVVGYIMLLNALDDFSEIQKSSNDQESVKKVRSGYILLVVAVLVGLIPILGGIIAFVLYIVGYVKQISGYKSLRESNVLPHAVQGAFDSLRLCVVWTIIGNVIGIVPLIGDIIECVFAVFIFIMMLVSWSTIKNNAPDESLPFDENSGTSQEKGIESFNVRGCTDDKLDEIIRDGGMYHPAVLQRCQEEREIRAKSKALEDKVVLFDDVKIQEVLSNQALYSPELAYCCEQEKARRERIRIEEEQKKIQEQLRINQQLEEARKMRISAWWKKWGMFVYVPCAILVVVLGIRSYNQNYISQYIDLYDQIVVQKRQDLDKSLIAMVEPICDNVIKNVVFADKHKGNAYHLKSYVNGNCIREVADPDLLYKAKELKSPLAIVETASMVMFEVGDFFTKEDVDWAHESLKKLDIVEADIILAASYFLNNRYEDAYELLSHNIRKATGRFKKDNRPMEYDESSCITTLGYNMLGVMYYYGRGVEHSLSKARHYLNYNSLMATMSDQKLAKYKPSSRYGYFSEIVSLAYQAMGDLLLTGYYHEKHKYYRGRDNCELNNICASFNFYTAAESLSGYVLGSADGLEDKLEIVKKIYKSRERGSTWYVRGNDEYYYRINNNFGVELSKDCSKLIRKVSIGPMYRTRNREKPYDDFYIKRGNCLVAEENLETDSYNVEIKTF